MKKLLLFLVLFASPVLGVIFPFIDPRIEQGTTTGQMFYWDDTANQYRYTETTELFWDDSTKRFSIGGGASRTSLNVSRNSITDVSNYVGLNTNQVFLENPNVGVDTGIDIHFRAGDADGHITWVRKGSNDGQFHFAVDAEVAMAIKEGSAIDMFGALDVTGTGVFGDTVTITKNGTQLDLKYDGSNNAALAVGNTGDLTITPTSGVIITCGTDGDITIAAGDGTIGGAFGDSGGTLTETTGDGGNQAQGGDKITTLGDGGQATTMGAGIGGGSFLTTGDGGPGISNNPPAEGGSHTVTTGRGGTGTTTIPSFDGGDIIFNPGPPGANGGAGIGNYGDILLAQNGGNVKSNGDIYLSLDNVKIIAGTDGNAEVYYDGTNLVIDPAKVGSGSLKSLSGRIKVPARYTTTQTLDTMDNQVACDTDSGGFTVTLPAGVAGTEYRIANTGTSGNNLVIAPDGSELLIGVNSNFTLRDGETLQIVYEASGPEGWF